MKRNGQNSSVLVALAASMFLSVSGAMAQDYKTNNPNMGHFYMARQQVQIIDETPVVNDQRGAGAAAGAAGGAPGAVGGGAVPLPRAGFTPYSSSVPSMKNSLPKVVNGVPPKMAPAKPGLKGTAGKLPARAIAPRTVGSGIPATPKAYAPYQGYGNGTMPSSGGSSGTNAATKVRGSLLRGR